VKELLLSAIQRTGAGGDRQTEIHKAEPSAADTEVAISIKSWKGVSRQVLNRFQQNWFKQGGGDIALRDT
jgi:hypothetical protein